MGVDPGGALMVGDDVQADVIGALDAGLHAALVRTGKYREGDEQRAAGAMVAADLAELVEREF